MKNGRSLFFSSSAIVSAATLPSVCCSSAAGEA
jgi:hypothetical protein